MREEGAERPGDARRERHGEADGARRALAAGDHDQRQPGQTDQDAEAGRERDAVARERAQQDHLQRHRARDHRGDARVDPRLGERDHADAERQQREPEQRGGGELTSRDADAAPAQRQDQREQPAGEQEARPGREERGQRLHRQLDREVGRAPDQVDGPERGQELPASRRGHVYSNRTRRLVVRFLRALRIADRDDQPADLMKLASWPRAFAAASSSGVERADPLQQLELVAQVRAHHLGAVGCDRERDAVLLEGCERLADRVLVGEGLREQVRSRADLEHDPGLAQEPHQLGVPRGEDAVADPVRAQVLDDLAELLAAGLALLADVDRDPEPGRARRLDHRRDLRVVVAAAAGTRAGDVDPDDAARRPADRLLDDDLVLARREGAVHHQDQPGAHLRVLERGAVEAADRGEDDVVEVPLAAAVALHRVEAELERRDPLAAVGAADRAVDGLLDGERRATGSAPSSGRSGRARRGSRPRAGRRR